jgi:hypothetical protein
MPHRLTAVLVHNVISLLRFKPMSILRHKISHSCLFSLTSIPLEVSPPSSTPLYPHQGRLSNIVLPKHLDGQQLPICLVHAVALIGTILATFPRPSLLLARIEHRPTLPTVRPLIKTCVICCHDFGLRDYRRGLDWRLDLLTTLTHDSWLLLIIAPSLISALYKRSSTR